jgi:hypothetical protein
MARLTIRGSTTDLRRKLFPAGFAAEVMFLVLNTWNRFILRKKVIKETRITAVFRDALVLAYFEAGKQWFVTAEDTVSDPDFGTELGRNDIRFYLASPTANLRQTIFFTIECKRLNVKRKSGFVALAREYVDDGIRRFVDGKYSEGLPCGGIVGYVMDSRMKNALASVTKEIEANSLVLKMSTVAMRCPACAVGGYKWSIETTHHRADGEFILHHILLPLSLPRRARGRSGKR